MIKITNLDVGYKKKKVVNNFSIDINKGEIVFLSGANGAGKTTLMRAIAGVIYCSGGEILVDNDKINAESRKKIAYISSSLSFYEGLKLKEAIKLHSTFFQKYDYLPIGEYAFAMNSRISSLSKGERTLFLLSLALSFNPEYLLIDDVIHFLDPHLREIFLKHLLQLIEQEMVGVVIAAQGVADIEGILERIVVIDKGKKVLDDSVENIKRSFVKIYADVIPEEFPVVFKREWQDMKELYVYPFQRKKGSDYRVKYLSLSEIMRAFIGGEYDSG